MESRVETLPRPRPAARGGDIEPNPVGRIGLFVAGYFGLGLMWGLYRLAVAALGDADLLLAAVAGALAGGLLKVADATRGRELEPLGIMAAFGSTIYVALAAAHLGGSTGADGDLLFWTVLAVAVPTSIATLLWLPHPILGINVAVGAAVFAVRAPVGDGGLSEVGGKALLLAFLLTSVGCLVDLHTGSRSGSVLHYSGVAALAFAKLIIGIELDALVGGGILAILGLGELGIALLWRRRSWAVSGWVTVLLATVVGLGASVAAALTGGLLAAVLAVPLGALALTMQRHGEELRWVVLDALPEDLAATFPR
jgi:hypothetical protein